MHDTTHATENQDAQAPAPMLPDVAPATGDQDAAPSTSDQHTDTTNGTDDQDTGDQGAASAWVPFYSAHGGYLYLGRSTPEGKVYTRLANFVATITQEIIEDDGLTMRRMFEIEAKIFNQPGTRTVTISASKFSRMDWVIEELGAQAQITSGPGMRDHVRAAIQHMSKPKSRHVYAHTGWREVDGQRLYLHAGGAIGAPGLMTQIATRLPDDLSRYELPAPLGLGQPLCDAIQRVLALLEVAPDVIMVPLLGAVFRAVLCPANFSLHLAGRTGGHKTGLAALCQQFFGAGMDEQYLPANWESSANALEKLASDAKNAILVIDDFVQKGRAADVAREYAKADRVLRGQGNASGRQRMTPDGSLQPTYHPRGIIISTGEEVPPGHSLLARTLLIPVRPTIGESLGDVNVTRLTESQVDGSRGTFAAVMSNFIQRHAADYADVPSEVADYARSLRGLFPAPHRRTCDIATQVLAGFDYFITFAQDVGAITQGERQALHNRALLALQTVAHDQADEQQASDPVQLYLRYIQTALSSGYAHVRDTVPDFPPALPQAWGWRQVNGDRIAQGRCIGWLDGADLYLDPVAAYAAAQDMGSRAHQEIPVREPTLRKRLYEAGKLASTGLDTARKTITVRRRLDGLQRDVLHVRTITVDGCVQLA